MKVEFWYTGRFTVISSKDGSGREFNRLQDALEWVEENWVEGEGYEVDIFDSETGEVLVHCEDDYDEDDYPDDDYDECGYNPYMGCYDWDC